MAYLMAAIVLCIHLRHIDSNSFSTCWFYSLYVVLIYYSFFVLYQNKIDFILFYFQRKCISSKMPGLCDDITTSIQNRSDASNAFQKMEDKIAEYNDVQSVLRMLCYAIEQCNMHIHASHRRIDYHTYMQLRHLEFLHHQWLHTNACSEQLKQQIMQSIQSIESLHKQASHGTMCPCMLLDEICPFCRYCKF